MKKSVAEKVTKAIIEQLESGVKSNDFILPWHRENIIPLNCLTGKSYRGANVVFLWASQLNQGFKSSNWATFKAWKKEGCTVKKGSKGTPVIFWSTLKRADSNIEDTDIEKEIFFAKSYTVFNVEQVEGGLADKITSDIEKKDYGTLSPDFESELALSATQFVTDTGADVRHGGEGAFYSPSGDFVIIPDRERFIKTKTSSACETYFSTLFHELTHLTGHKSRLNRDMSGRHGNPKYAYEELVAELGAAFLCAETGFYSSPREDHAQYLASWLKALKNDPSFLISAAGKAQAAVDYLLSISKEKSEAA